MRTSHRCPKCDHDVILHVPEPKDVDHDVMAVAGRVSMWTTEAHGALEAFVCTSCGFTELYVKSPSKIDMTKIRGAQLLQATKPVGPFR